jgi:hemerythrin
MDDQHGILMDTMNELRLALVGGCGLEQICELLDRLIEFTRMHFVSEEQLMEQTYFPGLADHRAEHHRMLAEMLRAAHRLQHGEQVHTRQMLLALRDGYLEHIEGLDQEYGPWMRERGID